MGVEKINPAVADILDSELTPSGLDDDGPLTLTKENLLVAEPPPEDSPAPSRLFERLHNTPAPAPRQSPAEAREEKQAAKDARPAPPGLKAMGWAAKKFPGAEKFRIHKRMATGQRGLVGTYSINDLSKSTDMESFISFYIKPKFGPGEYEVTGIDSRGNLYEGGLVNILGQETDMLPDVQSKNSALDVVEKLLDRTLQRQEPVAAVDPVREMGRIVELQDKLTNGSKNEQQSTLAAIIQAQSQQTQSMMQMIMSTLAARNDQPKEPDPVMLLLLKSLIEKADAPAAPLPPMPPPGNPMKDTLEILTALMTVMRPPQDGTTELLKGLLVRQESDRMGPREIIELMKTLNPSQQAVSGGGLKEKLEELVALKNLADQMRPPEGNGGGSTSFWDALGSLFQNKGLATMAAEVIRAKGGAPAPQMHAQLAPPVQVRALPQPSTTLAAAQEIEQRAELVHQQRLELAKKRLASEQAALAAEVSSAANGATPAPKPVATSAAPVATPEQEAAVARVQSQRGGRLPTLPPKIAEHVNAMLEAQDDAALVGAVIEFLQYLDTLPDWSQIASAIFGMITSGDQKRALDYLSSLFEGLVSLQLIAPELKVKAVKVLTDNFSTVAELAAQMSEEDSDEDESDEEEEDSDEDETEEELPEFTPAG